MVSNKRNGTIDFFKFVCAVMVAGYHVVLFGLNGNGGYPGAPFSCGYLAVEFYFIVSGYLLAAKAANDGGGSIFDANLRMIRQKFLGIFFYLYPAVLVAHAIYTALDYSPRTLSDQLMRSIGELFYLHMLGFPIFIAGRTTWYLSALMIASFLIYPLLLKNRELCAKYVAPVCALFCYGLILKNNHNLGTVSNWYGFAYSGMFRGIAGIFWGGVAYEISLYFNRLGDGDKPLLGAFEIFGYAFFLSYGIFRTAPNNSDFVLLLPLMLSVAISFSNKSVLRGLFRSPVFNWMGKFSLSIYLTQGVLRKGISDLSLGWDTPALCVLYVVSLFVLSLFNFWVGGKLAKSVNTVRKALFLIFALAVVAELLRIMCDMLGL